MLDEKDNKEEFIKNWNENAKKSIEAQPVIHLFGVDIFDKYEKKLNRNLSEVEWDNFAYQEFKKIEKKHKVNFDKGHKFIKKIKYKK